MPRSAVPWRLRGSPTRRNVRGLLALGVTAAVFSSCAGPVTMHTVEPRLAGPSDVSATNDADPLAHWLSVARHAWPGACAGDAEAIAIYNHAVGRVVESVTKATDSGGPGFRPSRTIDLKVDDRLTSRTGFTHLACDRLEFRGRYAETRATREGLGSPLVAIGEPDPDHRRTFAPPRTALPVTAFLEFRGSASILTLQDPLETAAIRIGGRRLPLAADFSAPIQVLLAEERPDKLGLRRMLDPQRYSATARLIRLQKYDARRIPVLMVHGLQDSPATWAPMFHRLMQDPEIRERYQFWIFSYPSGYPYPYSAALLRRELDGVAEVFPETRRMVLIGHSMGGVISRLMVTDAEDRLWRELFTLPPGELKASASTRSLLEESFIFESRKDVARAIFIAAPHRGSVFASNWIGRTGSRLVRIPDFISDARNAVTSVMADDMAALELDRAPNSIDTLSPDHRIVRAVDELPLAPGIPCHSIMGDRGKPGNRDRTRPVLSDGIVPFWSAHLDDTESEKLVPSGHAAHQHPEAIEEVRRILSSHRSER